MKYFQDFRERMPDPMLYKKDKGTITLVMREDIIEVGDHVTVVGQW